MNQRDVSDARSAYPGYPNLPMTSPRGQRGLARGPALYLGALALVGCQLEGGQPQAGSGQYNSMSEVDQAFSSGPTVTTDHVSSVEYDTRLDDSGQVTSASMGPGVSHMGGIVCDWTVSGDYKSGPYRADPNYRVWYVAPSDALMQQLTGESQDCGPGPKPECQAFRKYCGRKLVMRCKNGCSPGEASLMANRGSWGFADGATADRFRSMVQSRPPPGVCASDMDRVPDAMVLVINDFCPKNHISNGAHCSGNQVDLGPGGFLVGLANRGNLQSVGSGLEVTMLDEGSGVPLGPAYRGGTCGSGGDSSFSCSQYGEGWRACPDGNCKHESESCDGS
jgi:hypothetical protein